MIGSYDDISHRLSELFHIRSMKSYLLARPGTGQTIEDTGGLISPEVGDLDTAITTMAHDRPVTLLWLAEHDDDVPYQNFVYTDPASGERTLDVSKATNNDHNFTLYDFPVGTYQTSVSHGHATVDGLFRNKHWDVVSMRNFPERTSPTPNWIFNVRTVNTDWAYTGQTYGESNSISIDATTNGMLSTSKFRFYESYFWLYSTSNTPYQTQGLRGPVICFDRALSDAELHEFCCSPYEILRRHWSDVLFAVSPLTGEDFSLRRNHWQARYSTSPVTAEIESSEPVGLIPGIDHSSARVSGRWKSYFMPSAAVEVAITAEGSVGARGEASLLVDRLLSAQAGSEARGEAMVLVAKPTSVEAGASARASCSVLVGRPIITEAGVAARGSVSVSVDTTVSIDCGAAVAIGAACLVTATQSITVEAGVAARGSCVVLVSRRVSCEAGAAARGQALILRGFDFVGMNETWTLPSMGRSWTIPSGGRGWTLPDH